MDECSVTDVSRPRQSGTNGHNSYTLEKRWNDPQHHLILYSSLPPVYGSPPCVAKPKLSQGMTTPPSISTWITVIVHGCVQKLLWTSRTPKRLERQECQNAENAENAKTPRHREHQERQERWDEKTENAKTPRTPKAPRSPRTLRIENTKNAKTPKTPNDANFFSSIYKIFLFLYYFIGKLHDIWLMLSRQHFLSPFLSILINYFDMVNHRYTEQKTLATAAQWPSTSSNTVHLHLYKVHGSPPCVAKPNLSQRMLTPPSISTWTIVIVHGY